LDLRDREMTQRNINTIPSTFVGTFQNDYSARDPFCDPLTLLTTVFHHIYGASRVLYVIETAL